MSDQKFICALVICILVCSIILIVKINSTPEYDPVLRDEIYSEFDSIFSTIDKGEQINVGGNNGALANNGEDKIYVDKGVSGDKYKVAGRIWIPKIDVNYPVINTLTTEYLRVAPAKYFGPNMHEIGNYCIAGHNNLNEKFFGRLNELEIGDQIILTATSGKTLTYRVYKMYSVEETDMSCTSQETNGKIEVTLITCMKDNRYRLIVKCIAEI